MCFVSNEPECLDMTFGQVKVRPVHLLSQGSSETEVNLLRYFYEPQESCIFYVDHLYVLLFFLHLINLVVSIC